MRRLTSLAFLLFLGLFSASAQAATPYVANQAATYYAETPFPPFSQQEVYNLFYKRALNKQSSKGNPIRNLGWEYPSRVLYKDHPPRNGMDSRRFTIFPDMPYFDEKYAFDLFLSNGIFLASLAKDEATFGEDRLPLKEIVYSLISKDAVFLISIEIDMNHLDFNKTIEYLVQKYGEEGIWTYGELIPEKYIPEKPAIPLEQKLYFNETAAYVIACYRSVTDPKVSHLVFMNNTNYIRAVKKMNQKLSSQWDE